MNTMELISTGDDGSDGHGRSVYLLALSLLAVAGAVDAIGFLHARTFYVSFMSGNTTRAAIGLASGDRLIAAQGFAIIATFVAGVAAGELLTGTPPRRRPLTLAIEASVVLIAAAAGAGFVATLALALAMGLHNALILRTGNTGVALSYVTGTLVHIGRGLAGILSGRRHAGHTGAYAGMWLALAIGAIAGTAATRVGESTALVGIAVILTLLILPARARHLEIRS